MGQGKRQVHKSRSEAKLEAFWPGLQKDICWVNPSGWLPQQRSAPNAELQISTFADCVCDFRVFACPGRLQLGTQGLPALAKPSGASLARERGDGSAWNCRVGREEREHERGLGTLEKKEAVGNSLPGSVFYQDHGAGLFVCFRFNQCACLFFVAIVCVVMVPLTSTVCLSSLLGQWAGCCSGQDMGAWTTVPFPKSQHSSDFSNTPQKGKRNTVTWKTKWWESPCKPLGKTSRCLVQLVQGVILPASQLHQPTTGLCRNPCPFSVVFKAVEDFISLERRKKPTLAWSKGRGDLRWNSVGSLGLTPLVFLVIPTGGRRNSWRELFVMLWTLLQMQGSHIEVNPISKMAL